MLHTRRIRRNRRGMLILALKGKRKRSRFGPRGEACDAANALAVGTPVVVDESLCEVIPIRKGLARNVRRPDVYRVETCARIRASVQPFFFFRELAIEFR